VQDERSRAPQRNPDRSGNPVRPDDDERCVQLLRLSEENLIRPSLNELEQRVRHLGSRGVERGLGFGAETLGGLCCSPAGLGPRSGIEGTDDDEVSAFGSKLLTLTNSLEALRRRVDATEELSEDRLRRLGAGSGFQVL
jgi:hypothetical protein